MPPVIAIAQVIAENPARRRDKLTAADAKDIKQHYRSGVTLRQLAIAYDVTVSCIRSVVIGRTWKDAE